LRPNSLIDVPKTWVANADDVVDLYERGLIPTLPRVGVPYSLNNTGGGSAATSSSTNGPKRRTRRMPPGRAACPKPTQDTGWNAQFGDDARPIGASRHGTCEHSPVHPCGALDVRGAVGRRQVAAHWRGARVRDRDVRAAWLEDDAEDVRVADEGLGIV